VSDAGRLPLPSVNEDEDDEDECRICRDVAQADAPLITPCGCRGSLAFVHSKCLLHWLKVSHGAALRGRPWCTVCQQQFRFRAPGLASYLIGRPSWRPHAMARWLHRTAARSYRHLLHDASCGHPECLAMRWAIALAALQLSLWEGQMLLILSWGFIRDALSLDRALDEIIVPQPLQPLLRSVMPSPLEVSEFAFGFPDVHSSSIHRGTSRSAAAANADAPSASRATLIESMERHVGSYGSPLEGWDTRSFWVQLLMPAGSTEAAAHVQASVMGMGAVRTNRRHHWRRGGGGTQHGRAGRLCHSRWGSTWSLMHRLGTKWTEASHSVLRALLPVAFGRHSRAKSPGKATHRRHRSRPSRPRPPDLRRRLFDELDGLIQSAGRALYSLLLEPLLFAAAVRCAQLPNKRLKPPPCSPA
jgi:hypothetical protein